MPVTERLQRGLGDLLDVDCDGGVSGSHGGPAEQGIDDRLDVQLAKETPLSLVHVHELLDPLSELPETERDVVQGPSVQPGRIVGCIVEMAVQAVDNVEGGQDVVHVAAHVCEVDGDESALQHVYLHVVLGGDTGVGGDQDARQPVGDHVFMELLDLLGRDVGLVVLDVDQHRGIRGIVDSEVHGVGLVASLLDLAPRQEIPEQHAVLVLQGASLGGALLLREGGHVLVHPQQRLLNGILKGHNTLIYVLDSGDEVVLEQGAEL